jgi:heptosyltransferase-2
MGIKGIEKAGIHRILVRSTNWVGDAIMTLPALEAVRENFPGRHIAVLAKPWVAQLFTNHPAVDQVIVFDKGRRKREAIKEIARITRIIRKEHFDLAILFQNAFEAALLAFLGGVRHRVGYKTDGRGFLMTQGVPRNEEILRIHEVGYYCAILSAMGWKAEARDPVLHLGDKSLKDGQALLRARGFNPGEFIVGLSPGAVFGSAKRWPAERFSQIGDRVTESWGGKVVVFGSEGERLIAERVCDAMKNEALNLCGATSLETAMGVMRCCKFFVTNDSGLMHMAAGLGVPTVAVFGSTDPVTTGPRGDNTRIVRRPVSCAPCLREECPTDHRCMQRISPDAVWKEMESLKRRIS